MAFACDEEFKFNVKKHMESFLNKVVTPLVLVGCLFYVYDGFDQDPPPASVEAPVVFAPVTAPYANDTEFATKKEEATPLLFAGYPCGDDCSEHLAGYQWGRESGLSDPDNCDGRSAPFIEGCRVYVEEKAFDIAMTN
jgi:hypothetical protein